MLLEAQQHHFSAFVVKDHYCPTMLSAYIAEKYVGDGSFRVFCGIARNGSVGGINLKAVDAAVAMGAKLVWMPTVSALRHKIMHSGKGVAFPASKGMSVAEKPIMYLQEDGSLQPQVLEVLDYLAAHPDVILATGHGSRDEIDALIIGPIDISQSLGHPGDPAHPEVQQVVRQVIDTCNANEKPFGIFVGTTEAARKYRDLGASYIAIASDLAFMAKGYHQVVVELK